MKNSEFTEIAFKSLKKSYSESQIFNLSFDGNVIRITEYFITVNLCKELHKWNERNNYQYKIEAEKTTSDFYHNCFAWFKLKEENNIFSEMLFPSNSEKFKETQKTIRKGKIDITLSRESNSYGDLSEYIIEVKSVNPNSNNLTKDFIRIQSYLSAKIPDFVNSLKSGFIVFIKHINSVRKIQSQKDLVQRKEHYLNNLSNKLKVICAENITYNISTDLIENSPYENLHLTNDCNDFSEIAYNTYFAFSVVIEIKNSPSGVVSL